MPDELEETIAKGPPPRERKGPVGRPPKPLAERRSLKEAVWVNQGERQTIRAAAAAAGEAASEFMREAALSRAETLEVERS